MTFHAPGIYHDMPFEEYLADPALSTSGIKNLLISPLTYWINSPLNPAFEPEDTEAKIEGKAWHKLILEGQAAFDAAFCIKLDKADYPDHLSTGDELKKRCGELGLSKGGSINDMCKRIRDVEPDAKLWDAVLEDHEKLHAGKDELPRKAVSQMLLAHAAIKADAKTAEIFNEGQAEVSIFWNDAQSGVRMKSRIDWHQRGKLALDLKTFANSQGHPTNEAVGRIMHSMKYGIQAIMIMDGLAALQEPIHDFRFLFHEKGIVPNVLLRRYSQYHPLSKEENGYWIVAASQMRYGINLYRDCLEYFGSKPWQSPVTTEDFADEEFPPYMFK